MKSASGGKAASATLAYDAVSDSVTLTADAEATTFTPADVAIEASNLTRYEKTAGDTTTRLDLNWGYRSEWTTAPEYVALGQMLVRQRDVPTGIDTFRSIDFAFGLPSEASTVPRTGGASYALSFMGTRTSLATDSLLQMGGSGTALVDFAGGSLEIVGKTYSFNWPSGGIMGVESPGDVKAKGTIAAGENRFAGTFTATAGTADTYAGDLDGGFYGPGAKDIGGTLYGASGPLFFSLAFAGYGIAKTYADDTLANLEGTTRFRTAEASFTPQPLGNPLGEAIIYNAVTQTYVVGGQGIPLGFGITYGPANRTPDKDTPDMRTYGAAQATVDGKIQYTMGVFDGKAQGIELTYASFMQVSAVRTDLDGKVIDQGSGYIGFGNATAPDQMPRTGSASFAGLLFGDITDGKKSLASLNGRSELTANFATGALAASLSPVRLDAGGGSTALGKYEFNGAIDTYAASFAAAWSGGAGSLAGRFYGDKAQEYAAAFNVQDPVLGQLVGVALGARK
ncbi:transferrin-binding protein-like solute binding protein [Novosphingobium sp. BL-52-GroH]|uniref:transferrin-binding protein-like solute binding protein n=1 Tax=Novosphingobium sp. BL-52-GroH TaxID=3349877 RepID=UPI00384E1789